MKVVRDKVHSAESGILVLAKCKDHAESQSGVFLISLRHPNGSDSSQSLADSPGVKGQ